MTNRYLYTDDEVSVDHAGIEIHRYYFPFGGSKKIPWSRLAGFRQIDVSLIGGESKFWGLTLRGRWFARNFSRASRTRAIELNVGSWISPAVTPERPSELLAVLESRNPTSKLRSETDR